MPEPDNQSPENPATGNPCPANPTLLSINRINNNKLNNKTAAKTFELQETLSNQSNKEICTYPDSSKMLKKDGKNRVITQNNLEIDDYWRDEEDPATKWPKHIL